MAGRGSLLGSICVCFTLRHLGEKLGSFWVQWLSFGASVVLSFASL